MSNGASSKGDLQRAADIVAAAGGRLVGRTRLQKLAYLLELAGLGEGFDFQYRHYGPYSEGLALATHDASLIGLIHEEELPASWGGSYSVFTTTRSESNSLRQQVATVAAAANAVELELAATAAFLSVQGYGDPWDETARRKPDKAADGRLQKARELYGQFARVRTPNPIPDIA
jgi:uncharacterized protein YwgA